MTVTEAAVLAFFRRYDVGIAQMLFFNPTDCRIPPSSFQSAMNSLIDRGLVVKERPRNAYSLTARGHDACQRASAS